MMKGRLVQATTALGVIRYEVNALGLRVRKQAPYANTDTLYHYDAEGISSPNMKPPAPTTGNTSGWAISLSR